MNNIAHRFYFQGKASHPRTAMQEIDELMALANGILEFEKSYLHTHGERTPAFRMLSMINEAIAGNMNTIDVCWSDGTLEYKPDVDDDEVVPF